MVTLVGQSVCTPSYLYPPFYNGEGYRGLVRETSPEPQLC